MREPLMQRPPDILRTIVDGRRERLAREGYTQGISLPERRRVAAVPFPGPVVCEIKRRSPSRGSIDEIPEPLELASRYVKRGARSISVLTEQDNFSGSLTDLVRVKAANPEIAVLRKDFLLDPEDIRVSWKAGADAVLLIAAILNDEKIEELHRLATELGMTALVEVHDADEIRRVSRIRPPVVGINSRNLRTFSVDLLSPLALRQLIDWPAAVIFESGMHFAEDAHLAATGGFDSILVGETLVRNTDRLIELQNAMIRYRKREHAPGRFPAAGVPAGGAFWTEIAVRRASGRTDPPGPTTDQPGTPDSVSPADRPPDALFERLLERPIHRPLVKICGITSMEDALAAVSPGGGVRGADLLGLVYAESPRTAPDGLARELSARLCVPLVAVVIETADDTVLLERAKRDLAAGYIHALQLHGGAPPETGASFGLPYYRAIRPADTTELAAELRAARSPRVLIDAFHPALRGGSGRRVAHELVTEAIRLLTGGRADGAAPAAESGPAADGAAPAAESGPAEDGAAPAAESGPLWLAGGLTPDNVYRTIVDYRPELIDASSGLEERPGKKSPALLNKFFAEVARASSVDAGRKK